MLADAVVHLDRPQPSFERACPASRRAPPDIPAATAIIPFENGFLSEMLLQNGYNTYAVGKWHLTPAEQTSAAGPYDRWPLGRGFERYYGFLGGDTHQYYPGPRLRQPSGRAAEDAGGRLSPDRRPGRQGHRVHRRLQAGGARQAVLPVFLPRRARTRRITFPSNGRTSTRASSTTAGMPIARRVFDTPEGTRHRPEGRRAFAATIPTSRTGIRSRQMKRSCMPA